MKQRLLAAALTMALVAGATASALADGAASTRNLIFLGTAAVAIPIVVNYNHKMRAKRIAQQQVERRQDAYRDWFYHKYGYYPTFDQFKKWYTQTYGNAPG